MVTAKEAFEAKKLASKYGVPGKVAALYRMAGYKVEMKSTEPSAHVNFTATKRRERLAVRVYWASGKVDTRVLDELASSAGEGYRPVLVLYGSGPKVDEEVVGRAKDLGVKIRRVRPHT